MQRMTFRRLSTGVRWATLAAMMLVGRLSGAQVLDFVCEGEVRTDAVFETDGVSVASQRFRITTNFSAGYVKRDPVLAAGCFAGRTEICACEPPSPDIVVCRSLGFKDDGTEVSLDFTLHPGDQMLKITGRQFNARSGTLIETSGQLDCTRSPSASPP
jgi:hypothetical protein